MIEKIKKLSDLAAKYPDIHLPDFAYPAENPLFIDIETTGFSPQNAMIYAIGCIYKQNGKYCFHQLFADDYYEEDNVLIALEKIIQANRIDLLVHFNGKNFDLPFLKGRYLNTCLLTSLGDLPQFDFYLEWKKCKAYFELPNAKLKTLEKVLRLNRNDQMNGGQLIDIYHQYLAGDEDLLPLLLLHNAEDLLATFLLGHFLPFLEKNDNSQFWLPAFGTFTQIQKIETAGQITFYNSAWHQYLEKNFDSHCFSPLIKQTYQKDYPLLESELYHFFADYQNYIYLPYEDTAIHQSIAQFVEPAHRKKATKQTAYIKKKDIFIELPPAAIPYFDHSRLFQKEYKDKRRYLPLSEARTYFPE
ncbi:hypothetical protein EII17_13805 [Clostridiales bacterium COT073_COT-073]|nr:hypothetical protein EII17_13805 [Clostridiales bacterium COT073_COT-073]